MNVIEKIKNLELEMHEKYQQADLINYEKSDLVKIIELNNEVIEEVATNAFIAERRLEGLFKPKKLQTKESISV